LRMIRVSRVVKNRTVTMVNVQEMCLEFRAPSNHSYDAPH
jgi:hypothetical protein